MLSVPIGLFFRVQPILLRARQMVRTLYLPPTVEPSAPEFYPHSLW